MSFYRQSRNFLAISLLLLFVAGILFGWQWSALCDRRPLTFWPFNLYPQLSLLAGVILVLSVTGFFSKPMAGLRESINRTLESDTRLFFTVMSGTSLMLLLLIHVAVLTESMVAIGVILLARADLRRLRVRGWRQFAVLCGVSLMGFLGGSWLYWSWLRVGWLP